MLALPLQRIEGKYEILEKIREGGMGAIYKVRHRLLDEIRAIKVMRPQLVEDQQLNVELRARFVREARVAIKLRHQNIAQLYDFTADDDGTALIVMEFIRGKTLEQLLKTAGPPPLGLALEIAQQSLRALGYLHSQGFVHRDISPDNLMLTADGEGNPQIKLIDLGIAKILGAADARLTQTGTFLGKVRYASPEQFGSEGAATAGATSDLYSFGVVLYELLTGVYPITGRDPNSIIAGHMFRPPIAFEDTDRHGRVPPGLRTAVFKALAKKPEERYASAQEFARELARFRVPEDVPAEEWKKLLEEAGETVVSPVEPGSTQDRFDEHFGPEATPAPTLPPTLLSPVAPLAPTGTSAATQTQGEVDAVLAKARELLAGKDPAGAIAVLRQAPARSRRNREHAPLLAEAESQLVQREAERRRAADAAESAAALARQAAERQRQEAMAREAAEVEARRLTRTHWPAKRGWLLAGGGALLAALALGLLLRSSRPVPTTMDSHATLPATPPPATVAEQPRPAPKAVAASPPLVPARGLLRLNALPWARLMSVAAANGQPVPAGAGEYTPLALELPTGRYTVVLRGPDGHETKTVDVDVDGNAGTKPRVVVFTRVDADDYLRRAGL
ncbi:MAG TPA: protein kinase [Thermoanaerobaculia bacterium]